MNLTALTVPTDYSFTGYKEIDTYNGVAWSAVVKHKGKKVGTVENHGRGGADFFHFDSRAHAVAFETEAKARYGDDAFEPSDLFANDLSTAAQFNKKRVHIFTVNTDDFDAGNYRVFPAKFPREAVLATLASDRYAGQNPMLWDKSRSVFVPVNDVQAGVR